MHATATISIGILTRTILRDSKGKTISDIITNHLTGETYPTPRKKIWKGVCCKACWNAKGKRCKCRCKGQYHGAGKKKANG